MLKKRIVFLGPPGSGKGTYSTRLAGLLGLPHISTGDIFREAVEQGTELGRKVNEYLSRGELVPDEITITVLKERITSPDCEKGFILDGYPRTISQAKALDRLARIDVVIDLKIHEKILIEKLSARRICENCGEIYNVADIKETIDGVKYDMPPMLPRTPGVCDRCGGKLIQRNDDSVRVVRARLKLYRRQTKPLIRYYRKMGVVEEILVHAGPEVVVPQLMERLKTHESGS